MIIVADSSPLITLAIINKLELLDLLFDEIYVPEEVFHEISVTGKPFSKELDVFFNKRIKKVNNDVAVRMLLLEIDKGEAEAIILAIENNIDTILIDDYKGRRVARREGLSVIGTIGILLDAKRKGHISEIKLYLDLLISKGIRIGHDLYDRSLQLAQEA